MSFTDHKITAFAHKIADLPDQPTLPPDELKSRFDACPEELRQSLNAICDDAARLEARVEGIVVDTFGDTIDKEMLSDELAAELDAKAVETSVASRFTAEQTAREALETEMEQKLAQKCEIYCGTFTGDGEENRIITLGFTPKALFVVNELGYPAMYTNYNRYIYGGLVLQGETGIYVDEYLALRIVNNGFEVGYKENRYISVNIKNGQRFYIAFA